MLLLVQYFHPGYNTPNGYEIDMDGTTYNTTQVSSMKSAEQLMKLTERAWNLDKQLSIQHIGFMVYDPADPKTLKKPLFCNVSKETRKAVDY